MHDRTLLGTADVDDDVLTAMVAELLGHEADRVTVLDSRAVEVAYELPAITTAGRYWVSGTARTPAGVTPYRMFVKHVQAWSRSPLFAGVPPELRELAAAGVPWRTEPLAYRSDWATGCRRGCRCRGRWASSTSTRSRPRCGWRRSRTRRSPGRRHATGGRRACWGGWRPATGWRRCATWASSLGRFGQLIAGEAQLGRGSSADLPELDAACVTAYTRGLHDEWLLVDESVVRRAHALQLLIFTGLSALPVELLDAPPDESARRVAASRADLARLSLDLVDASDRERRRPGRSPSES